MSRLIQADCSLIISLDVPTLTDCRALASATEGLSGVSGFKLGFELGLQGLRNAARIIRGECDGITVYDGQKAGTDTPQMGSKFAAQLKAAGCDAVILYPFAGPKTQTAWTKACQDAGLTVLVGGIMTHEAFLVSEGGYISDDAPMRIIDRACEDGVKDFVVPGNRLDWVTLINVRLAERLGLGQYDVYAPGFYTQGGSIRDCAAATMGAGFHAIVGSFIYDQIQSMEGMRAAALTALVDLGIAKT